MHRKITQDDIIYFVVTDRFFGINKHTVSPSDNTIHGGTLDGILEKLDYLLELGITAIWITPVYQNITDFFGAEPYHYYWAKDFTKIDQRLLDGTQLPASQAMATMAEFINRCEQKEIKVILDMVVNHAGYGAETGFPQVGSTMARMVTTSSIHSPACRILTTIIPKCWIILSTTFVTG